LSLFLFLFKSFKEGTGLLSFLLNLFSLESISKRVDCLMALTISSSLASKALILLQLSKKAVST